MDRLAEETIGIGSRFGQMNRKYRRAGIKGFVGDIADGNLIIGGIIEDISIGGFKITHMPDWFSADKLLYTAILSGGGKHFRLLAKPCWKKKGKMGFKILDAPLAWVELTMNEIPEFDYEDGFCYEA
jgi:hypothetical protein